MIDSDINNSGVSDTYTFVGGETYLGLGVGIFPNPACANVEASVTPICPPDLPGTYYLQVGVDGGEYPYTITASNGETIEVVNDKASIEWIGPFVEGDTWWIEITDANFCSYGQFNGGPIFCGKLEVDLLSFEGEVQQAGNLLTWTTASEEDHDYFELLRSTDGINFESIYVLEGNGDSNQLQDYAHLDKNAPTGISYYQLAMVDDNGNTSYSNIISLVRGEQTFEIIKVFPIPTTDYLEVQFTTSKVSTVQWEIFDMTGRKIDAGSLQSTNGINSHRFNVTAYPVGSYMLSLHSKEGTSNVKFVKQ